MAALAVISALVTALCIGYHFGRRAGSTPSTWKKRTRRVTLGRLAINLLVLVTARCIRQSSRTLVKSGVRTVQTLNGWPQDRSRRRGRLAGRQL
jgi:hypothetical protein